LKKPPVVLCYKASVYIQHFRNLLYIRRPRFPLRYWHFSDWWAFTMWFWPLTRWLWTLAVSAVQRVVCIKLTKF